MDIVFDKYLPDFAPKVDALVQAENVLPYNRRLNPFLNATAFSSNTASGTPSLVFTVRAEDGTKQTILLCDTKSYFLDTKVLTEITNSTPPTANPWDWTIYGNTLVITNLADAPQEITIPVTNVPPVSDTFANLAGSPPKAKVCEMFDDHLFFGYTNDGTEYPRRVHRSAKGDITDWATSTVTGCGFYDIPAWGERVVAIKPLGDFLMVYMSNSVWKIYPVGAPIWFGYDRVATDIKALSAHSVIALDENTHIVLAEDDVYVITVNGIAPVGEGIRETILGAIDLNNADKITHSVNYRNKFVQWAIPTASSTDGNPDKMLVYNYHEKRFTIVAYAVICLGNMPSQGVVIDDLDDYASTIDGLSLWKIDSGIWAGGANVEIVITANSKVSTLTGTALDQTLEYGEIDFEDYHMITSLRPILEKPEELTVGYLSVRENDNADYETEYRFMRDNGLIDVRKSGRYAKVKFILYGFHQGMKGFKLDHVATGVR